MATATKARRTKAPNLDTLREQHAAAEAKVEELAAERRKIRSWIDPHVDDDGGGASSTAERLRAKARWPRCEEELAIAQAEAEDLSIALRDAEQAERLRQREATLEKLAPFVPKLDAAMREVEAILAEMRPLDVEAQGGVTDAYALLLSDIHRIGLPSLWRASMHERGLLPGPEGEDDDE